MTQLEQPPMLDTDVQNGRSFRELPVIEPATSDNPMPWFTAQLAMLIFLAGVAMVWLFSGSYQVGNGEVAVVERLGQYLTLPDGQPLLVQPGWHYHLPWPLDTVYVIPTSQAQQLAISDFNQSPGNYEEWEKEILRDDPQATPAQVDAVFNPYLITGDRNVVHSEMSVQYHISDPVAYLQSVAQIPGQPAGQAVQNVVQILADHQLIMKFATETVDEALGIGQGQNTQSNNVQESNSSIQGVISQLGLGLQVQKIQIESPHVPDAVQPAFSAVLSAQQDQTTMIQDAQTRATQITLQASSDAQTILASAQADANQVVKQATGEANAFSDIYAQYLKDPKVVTLTVLNDNLTNIMNGAVRVFIVQPNQRILITLPPPQEQVIVPPTQ